MLYPPNHDGQCFTLNNSQYGHIRVTFKPETRNQFKSLVQVFHRKLALEGPKSWSSGP